jgi:hypothetical protein
MQLLPPNAPLDAFFAPAHGSGALVTLRGALETEGWRIQRPGRV